MQNGDKKIKKKKIKKFKDDNYLFDEQNVDTIEALNSKRNNKNKNFEDIESDFANKNPILFTLDENENQSGHHKKNI